MIGGNGYMRMIQKVRGGYRNVKSGIRMRVRELESRMSGGMRWLGKIFGNVTDAHVCIFNGLNYR